MKGEVVQVQGTATVIAGATASQVGQYSTSPQVSAGAGTASYPTACLIRVPAGALTVYFGGVNSCVVPIVAGEDLEIDLVNEILYGKITSSTTSQTVYVLRRGD